MGAEAAIVTPCISQQRRNDGAGITAVQVKEKGKSSIFKSSHSK